jgi:hypothetical protein
MGQRASMNLAQLLYETTYRMPRGATHTAMIFATRPDFTEEACRRYVGAMTREALEDAFVILAGAVAGYREEPPKGAHPYPPNRVDL